MKIIIYPFNDSQHPTLIMRKEKIKNGKRHEKIGKKYEQKLPIRESTPSIQKEYMSSETLKCNLQESKQKIYAKIKKISKSHMSRFTYILQSE